MDNDTREAFTRIEKSLETLTLEVKQNSKDIAKLEAQANMGRGAFKVILFFGSLIAIVVSVLSYPPLYFNLLPFA